MSSLFNVVCDVLGLPPVIIGAYDYAPLITACVAGLCLILVVCNVFAILRFMFKWR